MPLFVDEVETPAARRWLQEDPQVATWFWSRVELAGAVERRVRNGILDAAGRRDTLAVVDEMARQWDEVADLRAVRTHALAILSRHDLRAADAAQLGAALLVAAGRPSTVEFVCLDQRLCDAAHREGLQVLSSPR